jgi:signal transduction histidine kinase/CheY-like chemotaxis protein
MKEIVPNLSKTHHNFTTSKDKILSLWISYDLIKEILAEHKIELKFFVDEYGSGVFDYFMDVIVGEVEIGNCPVMQKLLVYLKYREISADELFELCSHFRRAMVDFSYDEKINSKELFDEISYIFDKNFRGILKFYTDTIFQKLIDARQEALNAGQAKEYFLSNMSHEIRTPLNAILGFVNLLMDEDISQTHKKYLNTILESSQTLLSIINEILDFSKLRSGKFTIEPKIFSPYEELHHAVELFLASAKSKNITIDLHIDKKLESELYADILRIRQIISNLISNAIKFTPKDGLIKVDISSKDEILRVSVEDNGIGISQDEIENIFTPFVQVNHYEKHKSNGTGLGLSISHQLAKLMGGNIELESTLGKGSKFSINIPIKIHNPKPFDTKKYKPKEHKQSIDIGFRGHILVAEDNEANQELIKILLAKYGLSFELAQNGLEAFNFYKKNSYDLILMDEQMPVMDGNEAVKKILKYEKQKSLKHTPVCALTANVIKGDKERGLLSGFDAFLGKPIILKDLQRVFLKYLKVDNTKKSEFIKNGVQTSLIKGLDIKKLSKELLLSQDELRMLITLFIKKMEKILPELDHAIGKKDYAKIALLSHSIKGSSGNFRIEILQKEAAQMEEMAKSKNIDFDYKNGFLLIKSRVE